jgi:peptidoglycan/LPS O-acetylase OafA/YrhL
MQHLKYRRDIDGLRSLAIIPVVLFHAGFPLFSGGFVGVDVFFVISGYLITSIIFREQAVDRFSLAEFWARRARRILPAMVAVIAAVLVVGWFLLAPQDYQDLGRAARYQAFFASNIYFWDSADYFDTASELKPLLHMWSLAVEEQFYLLFPFVCLILALPFIKAYRLYVLIGLLLVSLWASVYQIAAHPGAVFYLVPFRAWELLAGSVLACLLAENRIRLSALAMEVLAACGLLLILFAVFTYQAEMMFPGLAALPPVLGAVLLILANTQKTRVARLLSGRALVGVGLISYSLYLWHWPVFAFAHYTSLEHLDVFARSMLVLLSFVLAYISWRWIENPIRQSKWFATNGRALGFALISIVAVALIGQSIRINDGFPMRLPEDARRYAMDSEWLKHQDECIRRDVVEAGHCQIANVDSDYKPRVLAWGDSHNASIMPALEVLSREYQVDVAFAAKSACRIYLQEDLNDECVQFNRQLYTVLREHNIEAVIISGRWSKPLYGEEGDSSEAEITEAQFALQLKAVVDELLSHDVDVWLLNEVPLQSVDVPRHLTKQALDGREIDGFGRLRSDHDSRQREIINILSALERDSGVNLLRPEDILCDESVCLATANGRSLYKDDDHLSVYGAEYIADAFRPVFESLNKR